jgi:heat shock protein HtpX
MSGMDIDTEHSASRALERGMAFTNFAQAAVLLLAFGALMTAALWPEFGRGAFAIAAGAVAAIVVAVTRIPPATMMQLYGARPYQAGDLAQFENITSELARRTGLRSPPRLYVVPSMSVSAFSFGSSRSFATAVTEGLLRRLTMREVAALLAREAAHAKRGDLLVLGIADFIARGAQAFYYAGLALAALNILRGIGGSEPVPWVSVLLLLLAPALMTALQLSLTRTREMDADRAAAPPCRASTPRPVLHSRTFSRQARPARYPFLLCFAPRRRPSGASRSSTPCKPRRCRRSTSPRGRAFR